MPIKLEYLGFDRSVLLAAAEHLLAGWQTGQAADLSRVLVVVPGRRAGRRLMEILVEQAAARQLALLPPSVETVGTLPEKLYEPKRPFADDLVQRLAWARALRQADRQVLAQIIPHPPAADDTMRWLEYGAVLQRQHTELAADALDFSHVAAAGTDLPEFAEAARWQALRQVQGDYLAILDAQDLWDRQTARLFAIEHRECRADKEIVLLGAVDMNRALRKMLDQVAGQVTALVFAPRSWAPRFDEHGCLQPNAWKNVAIDLDDARIRRVDGAADQADTAARCLAAYEGRYAASAITIGAPDEALVPQIARQLEQCGVASRWAGGRTMGESAPARLLAAVAAYLESDRYRAFAALVRHPDVYDLAASACGGRDFLADLDDYFSERLSARLGKRWAGEGEEVERLKLAHKQVEQLVLPLRGKRRRLSEWRQPITQFLTAVYGQREFDRAVERDRETLQACTAIAAALAEYVTIPGELAPQTTAAEAIRLALEAIAGQTVPPHADPDAVEILGWLELPLDDAPALVVTSLNEGFVPKSVNSDAFLPESLRRALGIEDNERRYARDAYALSVLAATRRDLDLIVARRDEQGNPLAPSRLLFAADETTVTRRALRFFADAPSTGMRRPPLARGIEIPAVSKFAVPHPRPLPSPIEQLRVTQFKAYLACRYRFYLEHLLRLQRLQDCAEELDARGFGVLLHDVLQDFGDGPNNRSTDADEIYAELRERLAKIVDRRLAIDRLAAVNIQIEQMLRRLQAFADWQAERSATGWRIAYVEQERKQLEASLDVDDRPLIISGRIDRIDIQADSGRIAILDYKTGDSVDSPNITHRRKETWIDLQLPLYRLLAKTIVGENGRPRFAADIVDQAELGYIALPKDSNSVKALIAEWSDDDLRNAEETARDVVRRIRDEQFWPPASPPPAFSEAFGAICQDLRLGRRSADELPGGES